MSDLVGSSRRTLAYVRSDRTLSLAREIPYRLTTMISSLPDGVKIHAPTVNTGIGAPFSKPALRAIPRLGLCRSRGHQEERSKADGECEAAFDEEQIPPAG